MKSAKALFLDRDGVINVDTGYVHTREAFIFIDGIFDLCRTARDLDFQLLVVTNQAGIAMGYYSLETYRRLTEWMKLQFSKAGVPLKGVYYCPYHPEGLGRFRRDSHLRKPNPGMLFGAAQDHGISLERSVLVGDKDSDISAGEAAKLAANIRYRGPGAFPHVECNIPADVELASHQDASRWLLKHFG